MNIILLTKHRHQPVSLRLGGVGLWAGLFALTVLLPALFLAVGLWFGSQGKGAAGTSSEAVAQLQSELAEQKQVIEKTQEKAQTHINALSQRLGILQAHVIRMDALGDRLTKMAKLDQGEFDFNQPPAQGGPENPSAVLQEDSDLTELVSAMDELERALADREQQLTVLESFLLHSNLQKQVLPNGRPITTGWLSSHYGKRNDPFTGKKEWHYGIDFAGKKGSDVISVAAGVVTWSGKRYGYGNLVEIDHGNGYVTRYGHNSKNLVKVGDRVSKGQVIALMGSSGRSTGPHVHFEVLLHGKVVDPRKYIQARR